MRGHRQERPKMCPGIRPRWPTEFGRTFIFPTFNLRNRKPISHNGLGQFVFLCKASPSPSSFAVFRNRIHSHLFGLRQNRNRTWHCVTNLRCDGFHRMACDTKMYDEAWHATSARSETAPRVIVLGTVISHHGRLVQDESVDGVRFQLLDFSLQPRLGETSQGRNLAQVSRSQQGKHRER